MFPVIEGELSSMPAVAISPAPILQFLDINGKPLSGAFLFTYAGGTTNKINTYTDSTGDTPNPNPIVLNALGEAPGIFVTPQTNIKFVLAPKGDSDPPSNPIWTVDNISTPSLASGTLALQDSDNVSITGGTVSVITLTCTGTSTLAAVNVSGTTNISGITNITNQLNTNNIDAAGATITAQEYIVTADAGSGGLQFQNQINYSDGGTATLTNAPKSGNADFWISVKINGSQYAIPAWKI